MNNIPLFDAITHPTINGTWLNDKAYYENNIDNLLCNMSEFNIKWAFAVGMETIGNYNVKTYVEFIKSKSEYLYPIAYFDFKRVKNNIDIEKYIIYLKSLGYFGIKIHPRFSLVDLNNMFLEQIIKIANRNKMIVMLCTYFYDNNENSCENNIGNLIKLLYKVKDEKLILLHSCTTHLLEMREIAAKFKNIVLDLSFTICRYEGSSLDLDIKYVFNNFTNRICVGSDSPDYSLEKLRNRFEYFSEDMDIESKKKIAYKNLINFCEIPEEY